ncbi:MAG TPA: CoA ester lyase [Rubrobacter sp.]|nr:CoA ester lyase [Rubrobacter sp.]
MNLPIRSYLYVPGYDARKIEKALASESDAVVLDLEDAVAPNRKEEARETVVQVLKSEPEKPVFVRVNAVGTELAAADIDAVVGRHLAGLRLPKIEYVESVRLVAETLKELRSEAGIQCLIESALGLELAFEIANSHVRVTGISLGEADLAADLGVSGEAGLLYARSRIVTAARAAGLPHPVQSVYTNVRDLDGLRRSTEEGKRLGFVGRSTIHPSQVSVVNEVFTPTEEEVTEAQELVDRLDSGSTSGAFLLGDGRFVDRAIVESARLTLDLARRSGAR